MITSFFAPKRKADTSNEKSTACETSSSTSTTATATTTTSVTVDQSTTPKAAKRLKSITPDTSNCKPSELSQEVNELMSNLTDDSWRDALAEHVAKPSFASLATFVAKERQNKTVYPPPPDTFTALNLVPLNKVKVVIVGQDPYHGPGQGHGLAFSVRKGVRVPPSLRNIYKELLENDCGLKSMPQHGNLERWASQSVLMLNSVLTVRKGEANSHKNKGWEDFTDEIIRCLFTKRSEDAGGLVFLLWGIPASKKAESIINRYSSGLFGGKKIHTKVFCSSHPSPLGATKTNAPFIGSKCFTRTNEALEGMGLSAIDWGVDGPLSEDSNFIDSSSSKGNANDSSHEQDTLII